MISNLGRKLFAEPLNRLVPLLQATGVSPNGLTLIGFILTAVSALLLAIGWFFTGGLVLIIAAIFDMLDGGLARATGQSTKFGAFFDSSIDRYSESVLLVALIYYYSHIGAGPLEPVLLAVTLVGSIMVSYTRARAEALGVECKVGILQRPERVILLIAGLLTGWMVVVLWLLAILTNITVCQRIYDVYKKTIGQPLASPDPINQQVDQHVPSEPSS
jgi:CDP-diacylglycerol--glycerol-3-phosphate 3-phosphatidyltransferase